MENFTAFFFTEWKSFWNSCCGMRNPITTLSQLCLVSSWVAAGYLDLATASGASIVQPAVGSSDWYARTGEDGATPAGPAKVAFDSHGIPVNDVLRLQLVSSSAIHFRNGFCMILQPGRDLLPWKDFSWPWIESWVADMSIAISATEANNDLPLRMMTW